MKMRYALALVAVMAFEANADSSTVDAAIGGGIGGAAGAAIGNEIGGRDGAIVGGAIGGAVGAAVSTNDEPKKSSPSPTVRYEVSPAPSGHPHDYHCPPGQRKKGRC